MAGGQCLGLSTLDVDDDGNLGLWKAGEGLGMQTPDRARPDNRKLHLFPGFMGSPSVVSAGPAPPTGRVRSINGRSPRSSPAAG